MSKKTQMLADAVAEADVLRSTALANAKLALQETFQPRLKSMLSKQLQREMEGDELEDEPEDEEDVTAVDDLGGEGDDAEFGGEPEEEDELEPTTEDEDVDDDEFGAEGGEPDEDEFGAESDSDEDDDELDLEAIIKELEGEDEPVEDEDELGGEADVDVSAEDEIPLDDIEDDETAPEGDDDDEDLDLEALVREFDDMDNDDEEGEDEPDEDNEDELKAEIRRLKTELKEAYATVAKMQGRLQEVNVFNSKLLFSTKLFRHFDLNENQKKKVIDAFDRTNTLREIKIVYSTLAETFKGTKVTRKLTESFASDIKAGKRNQPIVDGDEFVTRMQELANIKRR